MKKIALLSITCLLFTGLFAQDSVQVAPPVRKRVVDLSGRANDHFLLQIGYAGWSGKDSIQNSGFSKSLNIYFMFDFPFKTNPKLSIGVGPGFGTDNMIFKETYVGIAGTSSIFQILDRSDTVHFKKTKLTTAYLEAPVELRYTKDPLNSGKSFKFALGVKVGTMIKAYTKNKELQNSADQTLNAYTMKESSKRYFNTTRLSGHARIGWGHFTLFGSYQITTLLKEGVGPEIRPYSIGLTLSGL